MGAKQSNFGCIDYSQVPSPNATNTDPYYIDCELSLGYSDKCLALFSLFSIFGLFANAYLLFHFWKQRAKGHDTKTILKKMFLILSIIDIPTCLYWIFNRYAFTDGFEMKEKYIGCHLLSFFYIILFTFSYTFEICVLLHFLKINSDPIDGILRPGKNLFKYIIISTGCAFFEACLCLILGIIGKSPLVSCFIKTEFKYKSDVAKVCVGLALPVLLMLVGIYLIFTVFRIGMFQNDWKLATLFYSFTKYMLSYTVLTLPNFIVLFISLFVKKSIENLNWLRYLIQFTTLLTCAIPFILSIQRVLQSLIKIGWIERARKRLFYMKSELPDGERESSFMLGASKDEYEWMESHVLKYFMRDIFIGISYCIDNSAKQYRQEKLLPSMNLGPQHLFLEPRVFNLKNGYSLDDTIPQEDYEVKVIEYAPVIFAMVRKKEGIDIKEMVKSFLPKNNVQGIKKGQGKSGAFFISTDDNQYIIKTLKAEELELIRYTFLEKYNGFLKEDKDKNSILCPIYGIYQIITKGDNVLFFVMRNLFGNFKENITCKYDLKGSTLGRKQDLDKEVVEQTVMKDLNFEEIERALLISKEDSERLKLACENDSKFLAEMGLMDYSLLVVKLSLSKTQLESIFGNSSNRNSYNSNFSKEETVRESKVSNVSNVSSNRNSAPHGFGFGADFFRNTLKGVAEKRNPTIKKKEQPKEPAYTPLISNEVRTSNGTLNESIGEGGDDGIKYYKRYLYKSLQEGQAYIVSIIDYLTIYNFFKVVETNYKFVVQCKGTNVESLSCVDPKTYSERFIKFITKISNADRILHPERFKNEESYNEAI